MSGSSRKVAETQETGRGTPITKRNMRESQKFPYIQYRHLNSYVTYFDKTMRSTVGKDI